MNIVIDSDNHDFKIIVRYFNKLVGTQTNVYFYIGANMKTHEIDFIMQPGEYNINFENVVLNVELKNRR